MSNAKRQTPAALKAKSGKKHVSVAYNLDVAATKLSNIKLLLEYAAAKTLPAKVREEAAAALIKAGYMEAPKNYWNMVSSGKINASKAFAGKSTLRTHLSNTTSKLIPPASGKRKSARHLNTERTITNFARQKRLLAAKAAENRTKRLAPKKSPNRKSPPAKFGTISSIMSPQSP